MERILILDFGGQYNQLIARRVRECHVYCEVHPYTMPLEEIRSFSPSGSSLPGVRTAYMKRDLPRWIRRSLNWGSQSLASVTAVSCWPKCWAAR